MGKMIDGTWVSEEKSQENEEEFHREKTSFRAWVRADGSSRFPAEENRYHLYVSRACPWAHRTLIMRRLKGLEEIVSLSVVDPYMGEGGWFFSDGPGCVPDTVNGTEYLREVYLQADPNYTGRVTVPVLWDKERETIVNNESLEIMRMFDVEFENLAGSGADLYPSDRQSEIDRVIEMIYQPINNGVYRCGFAGSQEAYDRAFEELFEALDHWEHVLSEQRYLCGNRITEADWCMFTTLYRFDAVYYTHFKCNRRRIVDYPNLWNYLKDLYQTPGVAATCNLDHVKQHYYRSHEILNPKGIVPAGPELDFDREHDRDRFPSETPTAV